MRSSSRAPKSVAVVLAGHGSQRPGFDGAMRKVARALKREKKFKQVVCAYLSINRPSIAQAIRRCVRGGAGEVRVLPYFLLTGKHVARHIPGIVAEASKEHRGRARIVLRPYLGFDPRIVAVVKERVR